LEERLTGRTQRTTGLMVRYEVVKVSRLLLLSRLFINFDDVNTHHLGTGLRRPMS